MKPRIIVRAGREKLPAVEQRTLRALQAARKFSLVANSITSEVIIEPEVAVQ